MKQEDLKAILEDNEMDISTKMSKIQALSGADVQKQKDLLETQRNQLQANFDNEKEAWETEKEKFKDYVSKEDHQKVVSELENYKTEKENGRRASFLKNSYKVKEGYEDLIASKIDWSKASYDDAKGYVGDDFENQITGLTSKYPDLFVQENNNQPYIAPMGNFNNDGNVDLTKI